MQIKKSALGVGDVVEVSVTHEIKIAGEQSWIKYGVTTQVRENETPEDARDRASGHVNEGVMQVINDTVELVRSRT